MTPDQIQKAILDAGAVHDAAGRLVDALHNLLVATEGESVEARQVADKAHRDLLSLVANVNGSLSYL